MSSPKSLPEQLVDKRERNLAESDLSCSYWVEAGAGSGKTTLLIRRLLHIITGGAARLGEIAAITFTEKAAAELKARLRDELEKVAAGAELEKRNLARGALEELETAAITTIHSFSALLLRERPVEAAVDPHFKIYEPGEMDELLDRVWESWFLPELTSGAGVLARALTLGVTTDRIRQLGDILYHQRDLVAGGSTPASTDLLPAFRDILAQSLPELKTLMLSCRDPEDGGCRHLAELTASAERLLNLSDRLETERYFLKLFPQIAARGNQKNWQTKELCRRQKQICSELKQAQEAAKLSIWEQLTADLLRWCNGYLAAVEQAKEKAGVLDFQDLLIRARDLLRDSREVRGYFQRRFRYILVDEFQDTDPLQADLLFLLAEKEPRARSWQEAELAKGKLFLVGDPKQSIYRFRRADIEIYQAARQSMLRFGEPLAITQNFRTLPGLIEWVNRTFSILIKEQENYQPRYQPLSAFRPPHSEAAVVLLNPSSSLDEAKADEIRAAEALAIAELIEDAAGNWTIPAGKDECRALCYGDIALLFPTTIGLYHFEDALRSRKIPYRLEGGRQFYFREETAFLKSLLTAVSNPHDQIALVAALRYWFSIPDERIFQHTEMGGRISYFSEAKNFPPLQQAFDLLRSAHERQHKVSISALVEELLEKTWFRQRISLRPQGRQAAGNLRKALQMIRTLEMEGPLTLKGYVNRLNKMMGEGREEAESLIHDPGSDSVQLLTIHKSKGLEFPLVCLANMGGQSRKGSPFMADRSRGHYYIKLGELVSAGLEEAEKREALRLEAEQIRLFYVAATRARDYLVLPRFYKKNRGGFWSYLEKAEQESEELWAGCLSLQSKESGPLHDPGASHAGYPLENVDDDDALLDELIVKRGRWCDELKETIAGAAVAGPYISAGSLAGLSDEFAVDAEQAHFDTGDALLNQQSSEGTAFGSAFHRLMERIGLRFFTPEELAAEAALAAARWELERGDELARLARSTLEHPLLIRARGAKSFFRELPFSYQLAGFVVDGIIDLLFEEEEGLVIVDYKTDTASEEELERRWSRYKGQGLIYAAAMAEIAGLPVKEVSFIFVRKGLVKSIFNPDPAALHEMLCKNIK